MWICSASAIFSGSRSHKGVEPCISVNRKVTVPEGSPLTGYPFRYKLISTFWDTANVVLKEPEYATAHPMKRHENALGTPIATGSNLWSALRVSVDECTAAHTVSIRPRYTDAEAAFILTQARRRPVQASTPEGTA